MMKKLLLPILALYMFTHSVSCTSGGTQEESDVAIADDESFADEAESDFADASEETSDEGSEEGGDEFADAGSEESSEDEEFADAEGAAEGEGDELAEGGDELAEGGDELAEGGEESGEVSEEDELAMDEGDEESEFPDDVAEDTEDLSGETDTSLADSGEATPTDENLFTADNGTAEPTEDESTSTDMAQTEPPSTPADSLFNDSAPETADSGMGTDMGGGSSDIVASSGGWVPLKKIQEAPFEKNGALMNRVYVARPGDTWSSISDKIYASNRVSDLKKWNSSVASVKTGAKIYYNSPNDPSDSSRMLTYYEERGIPPVVYTTQDGDNIRSLGGRLLGANDGWKELWSTNPDVASKGDLPSGIELKYWPESAVAAAATAPQNNMAQAPPMDAPPADLPADLPPTDVANNQAPPMDPMAPPADPTADPSQMGDMAMNDPLNQPPVDTSQSPDMAPPIASTDAGQPPTDGGAPVPEPDPIKKKAPATAEMAPATDDTTIMVGIAGVALLLLVGVFVIMKKNRARRIDLSQTQV